MRRFGFHYFEGGRLIQVKIITKDRNGTGKLWPRPLNTGGRLIQVTNIVFLWKKHRDFEKWPLKNRVAA